MHETQLRVMIPLAVAFIVTLVVTPVVRLVVTQAGHVKHPSKERWHDTPTALMGGIAIYIGVIVSLLVTAFLADTPVQNLLADHRTIGVVGAATIMFAVGVVDDIVRFQPITKLVLEFSAATILVTSGVVYAVTPWAALNVLLTIFWFLGITNALNLLDNMDGVAAGVAGIAAASLATTFVMQQRWLLAGVCLALAGAAAGFLPYNFHRASIFMGDSGSLFIGSLLAGLGAAFPIGSSGIIAAMFVPALVVIIPIADTTLVTITRTLAGRPVSVGGRDHTAHRLVALGFSERQVAIMFYAAAAVSGMIALALQQRAAPSWIWLCFLVLVVVTVSVAYLANVHTYPPTEVPSSPRTTVLVSNLLYKGRALELALDIALFAAAYCGAYLLRFDGELPSSALELLQRSLAVVIACNLISFWANGVYRGVWQRTSLSDLQRVIRAIAVGALFTITALVFLFRDADFSRSVLILNSLVAGVLTVGVRTLFRSFDGASGRGGGRGDPALIYGAGKAGELLVRELRSNPAHGLNPVAFVDDDPRKHGTIVYGLPVLGSVDALPRHIVKMNVSNIVLGSHKLSAERIAIIERECRAAGARIFEFDFGVRVRSGEN